MAKTAKDASVGIVGAGPAGLSLAYHLSTLGISDITVFERGPDVGGQSVTVDVDGVPVEMGTCYLFAVYMMIASIIEEVGSHVELLPAATVLDEHGRELPRGKPPGRIILRYIGKWLRWYLAGQMGRPTAPTNALRFDRWLTEQGLAELATDFTFSAGLTAQLYGPIDAVTAHSGMTWLRPSLFVTGRFSKTYAVKEGFQNFWRALAKQLGLKLELDTEVAAVVEGPNGPLVQFESDGKEPRRFDLVYVACPLDSIGHPLRRQMDPYGAFEASGVYSGVFRGRDWPDFVPSRCYLPASRTHALGRVLTARRNGETAKGAVGQFCSYAEPNVSIEGHRHNAIEDLTRYVGLKEVEILRDRIWRYNVRFTPEQLRAGLPAIIDAHQGRGGIWYGGGVLSHWNVDSITDFNHTLARRMGKQLGLSWLQRRGSWRLDALVKDL